MDDRASRLAWQSADATLTSLIKTLEGEKGWLLRKKEVLRWLKDLQGSVREEINANAE